MAKLPIGTIVGLKPDPQEQIQKVVNLGLRSCQVVSWDPAVWTDQTGQRLTEVTQSLGVSVSSFWAGYTGPRAWNFIDGPRTIGLVPPEHREHRVAEMKQAAAFAAKFKLGSITTHVGFIPEDPRDALFDGTVEALKQVAGRCGELGLEFRFETGQETPVTLLRTIERIGMGNLGINLDPANLILYGKGNPVDALDVFGCYVRELHAKDGLYPTDGAKLGREVPLGEGKVNFPALISKLKSMGFTGALTIEREIKEGEQQIRDIQKAIDLLSALC